MKKHTLILIASLMTSVPAFAGLESLFPSPGTNVTTNVLATEYVEIVGYSCNTGFYNTSYLEVSYDGGVVFMKVAPVEGEGIGSIFQGPCILRLRNGGTSGVRTRVQFVRGLASAFAMHQPDSLQRMAKLPQGGSPLLLAEK